MPEKITLADGSEREVPTAEELKDLNTRAEAGKSAEQLKADLEKAQQELNDYKGQPGAEGMKNLRLALKNAKAAAKAKGIEMDDNGNVIDTPLPPKPEDIQKTAEEVYESKETKKVVSQATNHLDADSKAVFDKEFKEITEGKQVTSENVGKYIKAAMAASGIADNQPKGGKTINDIHGSGPTESNNDAVKSKERGIELASQMGYKFNTDVSKL